MGAAGPPGDSTGLDRRSLLTRVGAAALTLAGALAPGTGARARASRARLRLREIGGDVWTRRISVRGHAAGRVDVRAGGRAARGLTRRGERFSADLEIAPGPNRVVASSGAERAEALYRGKLRDAPTAVATARIERGRLVLDGSSSRPAPDGEPLVRHRWRSRPAGDELPGLPVVGAKLELEPPACESAVYLSLEVVDAAGRADVAGVCLVAEAEEVRPAASGEPAPWIADAVVYGAIPFAFGYRGFADVRAALDRVAATGSNTLWLSPSFVTERYEFGYGIVDFFATRRDYGGETELRRLISAAHTRGMRVLFDIAVNHSSREHAYFQHAERHGRRSHQYPYYERGHGGRVRHYFDWTHLPNLNYDNPEVRAWMKAALVHWVRELDIDGYRLDAAWGVRRRRPDFWPEAIAAVRRVKPDAMILAEASAEHPYYLDAGFDLAYDWTEELGRPRWEHVFDDPARTVARLDAALGDEPSAQTFRFLNNNDTGERFAARHGIGTARAAAALLMTLPGVPCVYTGDESGAEFDPYETYGPIDWHRHPELRRWYRRLGATRRELRPLRSAAYRRLRVDADGAVFAFERGPGCVVAINFSPAAVAASIDGISGGFTDHLSGSRVDAAEPIELGPHGAVVLVSENSG